MGFQIGLYCRVKLDEITEKWLQGLLDSLSSAGASIGKKDNFYTIFQSYDGKEILERKISKYDIVSFILGESKKGSVYVSDYITYNFPFPKNDPSLEGSFKLRRDFNKIESTPFDLTLTFDLREGILNLIIGSGIISWDWALVEGNYDRFATLSISIVKYLRPLFGFISWPGYRILKKMNYVEIFDWDNKGSLDKYRGPIYQYIIVGPKGRNLLKDSIKELEKLGCKVHDLGNNLFLEIIIENPEKVLKIIGQRIGNITEE